MFSMNKMGNINSMPQIQ